MSNPLLGELEIKIGDEKFTLRPTFEGLLEMEARSGSSVAQLSKKIMLGITGIQDATAIAFGGIYGHADGKPNITFNELGNKIMKHGYPHLLGGLGQFIGAALTGTNMNDISDGSDESKKNDTDPEPAKLT